MSKHQKPHYAFAVLIGCCALVGMPAAMTINCAGIFLKPISAELGIGFSKIALSTTIMFVSMAVFMPLSGKLMGKYDVRLIAGIAVSLTACCLLCMSTFYSPYLFYFTGAVIGFCNTFTLYLIGPALINNWFKARPGFYLGIVMAFTGIGGMCFSPLGGYCISTFGWRVAYRIFAMIIMLVAFPVAVFILRGQPSDLNMIPYGSSASAEKDHKTYIEFNISPQRAVKTVPFLMICIFTAVISLATAGINQYIPSFVTSIGLSSTMAGSMVSIANAGNMCGKAMLGTLNDKNPHHALLTGSILGFMGIIFLLTLSRRGITFIIIGAFIFGISLALPVVQSAMFVRNIFGSKYYTQIYAYVMTITSLGSGFGAAVFGYSIDLTGDFSAMFVIGLIMVVIACISGTIALKTGKNLKLAWVKSGHEH